MQSGVGISCIFYDLGYYYIDALQKILHAHVEIYQIKFY